MKTLLTLFLLFLYSTLSAQTQQSIWQENFPAKNINSNKWITNPDSPSISEAFRNSKNPYCLKLKRNEFIESTYIKTRNYQNLSLSFNFQIRNTEFTDKLNIETYINNSWITIGSLNGDISAFYTFLSREVQIPDNNSDSLKIRINVECDEDFEAWYIDNLKISTTQKLELNLSTEPLDFIITRRSSPEHIIINNIGMNSLKYNITYTPELYSNDIYKKSLNIAVLGNPVEINNGFNDVVNNLRNLNWFNSVIAINIMDSIPSYKKLIEYDAIFACLKENFTNKTHLGDTLAVYFENGGGVVLSLFCRNLIYGEFRNKNYFAFKYFNASRINHPNSLGIDQVKYPAHPIFNDIENIILNPGGYYTYRDLSTGAVSIARWTNNKIIAATKIIDNNRLVELGFHPASSGSDSTFWDTSTDAIKLLANSLAWVAINKYSNVLSFSKVSEIVEYSTNDTVSFNINTKKLIFDNIYSGNINIFSNDINDPEILLPVSILRKRAPYYFELNKSSNDTSGLPGTSVNYIATIINKGLEIDSYTFKYEKSNWNVSFSDTSGSVSFTSINNVAANDTSYFKIKLDIPNEAIHLYPDSLQIIAASISDTTITDTLVFITNVEVPPNGIPWEDNFSSEIIDTTKWTIIGGAPTVYRTSLRLTSNDIIETKPIYIHNKKNIQLSYDWRNSSLDTSGIIEISVFDNSEWITLIEQHPAQQYYSTKKIYLPDSLSGNSIVIKLQVISSNQYSCRIDNIKLYSAAGLSCITTPTKLIFNSNQGEITRGQLQVTNTGEKNLQYSIEIVDQPFNDMKTKSLKKINNIHSTIDLMKNRWLSQQQYLMKSLNKSNINFAIDDVLHVRINSQSKTDLNIAILGCEHVNDVADKINNTNTFASVSLINTRVFLPTLSELHSFDAILVYSGEHYGFYNTDSLGNILANYVDQKGKIVIAGFVFKNADNFKIGGRFLSENYYINRPYKFSYSTSINYDSLKIIQQNHPVFSNIKSVYSNYYNWYPYGYNMDKSLVIGAWTKSKGIFVAIDYKKNIRRVELGMIPYSSDIDSENGWLANSDGAQLMANALSWVAQSLGLSKTINIYDEDFTDLPEDNILLPYKSHTIHFEINTDKLIPDKDYKGYFVILNNGINGLDSIDISVNIKHVPHYFTVTHDSLIKNGYVEKKALYNFKLHNTGSQTDSYSFMFENNRWPAFVKHIDSDIRLNSLDQITADSIAHFQVEIPISDSTYISETDSLIFTISSTNNPVFKKSYNIITFTEWKEIFKSSSIDTLMWSNWRGQVSITSNKQYVHSKPYSLVIYPNSMIISDTLNFKYFNKRKILLKLYYKNNQNEAIGDLSIQCYGGNDWIKLKKIKGSDVTSNSVIADSILISDKYFNSKFRIRFETEFKSSGYWFIDDIEFIDITIDSLNNQKYINKNVHDQNYSYNLKPNFPNPFNPGTKINYSLAESGHVKIEIYNILGQKVSTLVEKTQQKGNHQLFWDASDFSAGLYFCMIKVNSYIKINKMMLLK